MSTSLCIETVVSQAFDQNTFVAYLQGQDHCLVVDPGMDTQVLRQCLDSHALIPAAILNTHGHLDHIAGNRALKEIWPDCPLVIGQDDAEKLVDPVQNLSAPFGQPMTSPAADVLLDDGDCYAAAGVELDVLAIPGHSRGHIVYLWKGDRPWILFGGDVLFRGSVGRADFPDGDLRQLVEAIRAKLFVLPDDTVVLPGHGERTTIGEEKASNPYVGRRGPT